MIQWDCDAQNVWGMHNRNSLNRNYGSHGAVQKEDWKEISEDLGHCIQSVWHCSKTINIHWLHCEIEYTSNCWSIKEFVGAIWGINYMLLCPSDQQCLSLSSYYSASYRLWNIMMSSVLKQLLPPPTVLCWSPEPPWMPVCQLILRPSHLPKSPGGNPRMELQQMTPSTGLSWMRWEQPQNALNLMPEPMMHLVMRMSYS